jgi:CheY-like chemotaxis protein
MVFMELLHQAEKPRHGSRPADSSEALSGADEVTPRLDRELVAMTANAMEQDRHRCMDAGTAARTYDEGRLRQYRRDTGAGSRSNAGSGHPRSAFEIQRLLDKLEAPLGELLHALACRLSPEEKHA